MTPIRALLIYLIVVLAGGALLAPWLYHVTQWMALHLPGLEKIAQNPFHRFVNRSMLFLALAGLWPLLRSLGMRSGRDLGFENPCVHWGKLGTGFALGFISLACVVLIVVMAGARTFSFDHSAAQIGRYLYKAVLAAAVVAVLEETLFRGGVFGGLRRAHHWTVALIISSGIYAMVHFFSRPPSPEEVHWGSGLASLPRMLRGFGEIEMLVPGFFNLTLAGVMLGYAYQRTGNLYFSIGLHAGWIFWLKSYGFWTREAPGASQWVWGTGKMIDGWVALLVLALSTAALYGWLLPGRAGAKKDERAGANKMVA